MLKHLRGTKILTKILRVKFSENKPIKFKDVLDLETHKTEIYQPNTWEYLEDNEGKITLNLKYSDEEYLKRIGINIPQQELRSAYYSMMHENKVYHVFNAEMMVFLKSILKKSAKDLQFF
jgi:hypothetical protein